MINVPVEPSFVSVHDSLVVVGHYHHLVSLEASLVGYIAPSTRSTVDVSTWSVVSGEVDHEGSEGPDLHVGVFPDQTPSSSTCAHVTPDLRTGQRESGFK